MKKITNWFDRTWMECLFRGHVCYAQDIVIHHKNTPEHYVTCPCRTCGKVLTAPYGLILKARLIWQNRAQRKWSSMDTGESLTGEWLSHNPHRPAGWWKKE